MAVSIRLLVCCANDGDLPYECHSVLLSLPEIAAQNQLWDPALWMMKMLSPMIRPSELWNQQRHPWQGETAPQGVRKDADHIQSVSTTSSSWSSVDQEVLQGQPQPSQQLTSKRSKSGRMHQRKEDFLKSVLADKAAEQDSEGEIQVSLVSVYLFFNFTSLTVTIPASTTEPSIPGEVCRSIS